MAIRIWINISLTAHYDLQTHSSTYDLVITIEAAIKSIVTYVLESTIL